MDQLLINRIVEAALLASSQPLPLVQLNGLFPLDEAAPEGAVEQALQTLQADCAERGVELVELASGWRFQVKADVHAWVARLWTERQTRYTRATLETLALIAYRQPITRGEIEQVRGVATNSNIIKALEEREWIRVVGHRDIPGRPELLGTTKGFLDYFGLKRLDELPPLSELKDFGELEPQFQFSGEPREPRALGDIAINDADADAAPADAQAAETDTSASSDEGDLRHADAADTADAGHATDAGALADGHSHDNERADSDSDDHAADEDTHDSPPADADPTNASAGTTPPEDAQNQPNALAEDGDSTRSNA